MYFITGIPTSKGKDIIFFIIHYLNKYYKYIEISLKYKADQIANIYVKNIYKIYGFPKVIVNDRDPKFTRNVWKELLHQVGTTLTMRISYHPKIYGQTKVVNK
jgi:hypothetical protein